MRECTSVDSLPPSWPNRLQATGLMTAVRFDEDPFPTRIFYDWSSRLLNTTLYPSPLSDQKYALVARLLGDTGYFRHQYPNGDVAMCAQSLPGPPVRDWKRVDGCECRAEIAPESTLNPSAVTTKILWCPTDLAKYQVFWTWYQETGKPVTFMQTRSSPTDGTGLNLADYSGWLPGSEIPASAFNLPSECEGLPKIPVPDACHNCHLPLGHQGGG